MVAFRQGKEPAGWLGGGQGSVGTRRVRSGVAEEGAACVEV